MQQQQYNINETQCSSFTRSQQ